MKETKTKIPDGVATVRNAATGSEVALNDLLSSARKRWIPIEKIMEVVDDSKREHIDGWHWGYNSKCKYIELRIDMRDGHCLLKDRKGNEVTLEQLKHQAR